MYVTACHAEPINQRKCKPSVGIFAWTGALYGRKAESILTDYFSEQRVTDVQSGEGGREAGPAAESWYRASYVNVWTVY